MHFLLTSLVLATSLLLGGCFGADTSDPRKGGLFGYSPKNYEARLEERQSYLDELDQEYARSEQEKASLEQTKSAKQAKVAAQRKKLAALDREVNSLKAKIKRAKNNPSADPRRLSLLENRRQRIQSQSHQLSGLSNTEREARIREMQRELKQLEAEADALSRM